MKILLLIPLFLAGCYDYREDKSMHKVKYRCTYDGTIHVKYVDTMLHVGDTMYSEGAGKNIIVQE